ncbi:MAG TPA: hypothetical protein VGA99_04535 [bacterium]
MDNKELKYIELLGIKKESLLHEINGIQTGLINTKSHQWRLRILNAVFASSFFVPISHK